MSNSTSAAWPSREIWPALRAIEGRAHGAHVRLAPQRVDDVVHRCAGTRRRSPSRSSTGRGCSRSRAVEVRGREDLLGLLRIAGRGVDVLELVRSDERPGDRPPGRQKASQAEGDGLPVRGAPASRARGDVSVHGIRCSGPADPSRGRFVGPSPDRARSPRISSAVAGRGFARLPARCAAASATAARSSSGTPKSRRRVEAAEPRELARCASTASPPIASPKRATATGASSRLKRSAGEQAERVHRAVRRARSGRRAPAPSRGRARARRGRARGRRARRRAAAPRARDGRAASASTRGSALAISARAGERLLVALGVAVLDVERLGAVRERVQRRAGRHVARQVERQLDVVDDPDGPRPAAAALRSRGRASGCRSASSTRRRSRSSARARAAVRSPPTRTCRCRSPSRRRRARMPSGAGGHLDAVATAPPSSARRGRQVERRASAGSRSANGRSIPSLGEHLGQLGERSSGRSRAAAPARTRGTRGRRASRRGRLARTR